MAVERDTSTELKRFYYGCTARLKAWPAENHRCFKPSLPSVIMGNVKSLPNIINELAALEHQRIYCKCSLLVLMELTDAIPDANVELRGYTAMRVDRDVKASWKSKGGGLIIVVSDGKPDIGKPLRQKMKTSEDRHP